MHLSFARVLAVAFLLIMIENVRAQDSDGPFSQGMYVWMSSSSISLPILRGPDEHLEMPIAQSGTTNGFAGGYEWLWEHVGLGLGGAYWKLKMQDFRFDIFQGTGSPSDQNIDFIHPEFSVWTIDGIVHILPWEQGPISVFAHLGMGNRTSSYIAANAQEPFAEWNGPHSISEFEFTYGVGLRYFPVKFLSVIAEYRLAPGDLSAGEGDGSTYVYYYSNGTTSSVGPSGTFEHITKILSLGLRLTIEM